MRGRDQAAAAQYRGCVSFDAPDRSALVRAVHDAWDRRLRLVHITIADEDGDGYPSFDVDRWVIEVRVPLTDDEAEAAPVARVTAFTVRAPDEVEEIVRAQWRRLGAYLLERFPGVASDGEVLAALLFEIAYAPALTFVTAPGAGALVRFALPPLLARERQGELAIAG